MDHIIEKNKRIVPNIRNLQAFLIHGAKYVFVAERGELTRGIPTMYAAPLLKDMLLSSSDEPIPVWPDPEGEAHGVAFYPLHKSSPQAAKKDQKLYELLVLVDSIRGGRVREQELAKMELIKNRGKYVS